MGARLNPYLSFADGARQAMEFYQQVFGGELTLNTYGGMGMPDDAPGADRIMHGMLETDGGFTLMGADNPPGEEYRQGNNVAVSLSGNDADALRGFWEQLSEGGTIQVSLEPQMWGDEFGMCEDRFGVAWMVNISS